MPHRYLYASFVALLFLAFFLAPSATHGAPANHLLISEVLYDPAASEPGAEFVELFNPTPEPVSLAGWSLKDNTSSDSLPDVIIAPGQFLVVASNQADFLAANPGFSGALVALGGAIGNGLSNSDDRVELLDSVAGTVDAMSYGSDASAFSPPCPDLPEGQSLGRPAPGEDGDTAGDWSPGVPSPGGPWTALPQPTATNTATAPATFTPTPSITPTSTTSRTPTFTITIGPTATPTASPTPTSDTTWTATPTVNGAETATPSPSATPDLSPTPTATANSWPALLLSEVFYDSPQSGTDSEYEFLEIFNPTNERVSLAGWRVGDNGGEDVLPDIDLEPGASLVIVESSDGFRTNFPSFSGDLIVLGSPIGNGLSNTGDRVRLIAPDGSVIDALSYGSDASAFDPACPDVAAGESLARVPSGLDTDTASDWHRQVTPNPGEPGEIENTPTPTWTPSLTTTHTPTHTSSPTRTVTPTSTVTPTADPSWTPPATPTVRPIDTPTSTATTTRTPTLTPSPTGTSPSNWPRLLLSEVLYDPIEAGSDADWEFVELYNPTGAAQLLSGWRIGDNTSQDAVPEFALPAGAYAVVVAKEAQFRASFPTFTGLLVSLEGNIGNGLSNTGDSVRLIAPDGNVIDALSYGSDKSAFDPPCERTLAGESLARWNLDDTDTAADWVSHAQPGPGEATTLSPTATPTMTVTPTATLDPTRTVTVAPSRTPGPTPTATLTPTPTALSPDALKVTLNEILPDPRAVDWDHDGTVNFQDEWIELYNAAEGAVSLSGWQVSDDSATYNIPAGTVIWPRSFLLLYRAQTRLSLSDWRDSVVLRRSDGSQADSFGYDHEPGGDRSFCRSVDGAGAWTRDCEVTPGQANRLLPPPAPGKPGASAAPTATPVPQTVAGARAAKEDSRIVITGTVTLPPGLIAQTIYLQDKTGGIKIYLRKGEYPPLEIGDQVRVTGWTRNFYGETEISVPDPGYLTVLGPGEGVLAKPITSAGMVEANEGQLVQVVGAVVKYETRGLVLKDRSGLIRIYFPESLPWRRPYVEIGQTWAAQGVLGQSVGEKTTDAGYRIVPRFKSDVVYGPRVLPVTGGALAP